MSNQTDEPLHVRIHTQCGACGFSFKANNRIAALIYSDDNTLKTLEAYTFLDTGDYCEQGPQSRCIFCRHPKCRRCSSARESATIHQDCYSVFAQRSQGSDLLQRLWTVATWRYPWHGALPLRLSPDVALSRGMDLAAQLCHQPQLRTLPVELARMIWNHSRSHMLWQYSSALCLADALSENKQWEEESAPLCEVYAWHRGDKGPAKSRHIIEPIVRLTIDSLGIRQIERLSESTVRESKARPDAVVFIVEPVESFSNVAVLFKFGLSRLRLPLKSEGFRIWDTPAPPTSPHLIPSSTISRLATIDTRVCTGITFFILSGTTCAVHVHTARTPYAYTTFDSITLECREFAAWVFTPMSSHDSVDAFGVRVKASHGGYQRPCYLFRRRLSGDQAVGPHHEGPRRDFVLSTEPQSTLFYNVPEPDTVCTVGASPGVPVRASIEALCSSDHPPFDSACLSSAPLDHVVRAQTFVDSKMQVCRGIILEYDDGSRRAIGQCRIGLDSVQTCDNPSQFCFAPTRVCRPMTEVQLDAIKVDIADSSEHNHSGTDWKCYSMAGVLEMWFTGEEAQLKIIGID